MVNYIDDQENKDIMDTLKELSDYIRRWESDYEARKAEIREDIGLMKNDIEKNKVDLDDIFANLRANILFNESKMEGYKDENRDIINMFHNRILLLEHRVDSLENRLQQIERREKSGDRK